MPAFAMAALPIWSAILPAAATVTTGIVGAKMQSNASNRAANLQGEAIDKQLAFEREQEERRRYEWDRTEAENLRREQEEVERNESRLRRIEAQNAYQYNRGEAVRTPYRQVGVAALADLGRRAGITIRPSDPPPAPSTLVPAGWREQDLTAPPLSSVVRS